MMVYHANQVPWPVGKPRTSDRKFGKFKTQERPLNISLAAERVERAVRAFTPSGKNLRTKELWMYADAELGARLRFLSNQRPGRDPAVVVRFDLDGKEYVIATDRFTDAAQNLGGIAAYIESVRAQERYGIFEVEDMLGFAALPAPSSAVRRHWTDVLGLESNAAIPTIQAQYRKLAAKCHPDAGGSAEAMAELNDARDEALKEKRP
jgi:hypothetical protein